MRFLPETIRPSFCGLLLGRKIGFAAKWYNFGMEDKTLREHLLALLKGGNAHMTLEEAVADFPQDKINDIFPNGEYSSWHLLEHIRRTQNDILNFIINLNYQELSWPKDYWPARSEKATKKDWEKTINSFQKDIQALEKLVASPKTDLFAKIKWGDGQTILREILLVADHNAYHIGELAIMRQTMDAWK